MEKFFHLREKRPKKIRLADGTWAVRSFHDESDGRPAQWGKWPIHSTAMGVHPSQVKEAMRRDPKAKFDKLGRCVFDSQKHMDGVVKRAGFVDYDAYH